MDVQRDYHLLLVDVRGSTRMPPERVGPVMERLETTCGRLNERFGDSLALDLSLSYGDEVAGLFLSGAPVYRCVVAMRETLYPDTGLRFVVAEGRIGVASDDIRKVGGPVFKVADEAMDDVKTQRLFGAWLLQDRKRSAVLDALTRLSNAFVEDMTDYQRTVYSRLREGATRSGIADELGKYRQSVSDAARRGAADLVLEAEEAVDRTLGGGNPRDVIAVVTKLRDRLVDDMTEYQRTVYRLMRAGRTGAQIAEELGKHRQSVSDAATRAHADLAVEADRLERRFASSP